MESEDQLHILARLSDAQVFEEFIRKKFLGGKSFSIEGRSLIPLLDSAIEKAAQQNVLEIVLGMAHRGRLNVLANILGRQCRKALNSQ
jgi:2-oxoglutarate dehydrogenase E1 component